MSSATGAPAPKPASLLSRAVRRSMRDFQLSFESTWTPIGTLRQFVSPIAQYTFNAYGVHCPFNAYGVGPLRRSVDSGIKPGVLLCRTHRSLASVSPFGHRDPYRGQARPIWPLRP